MFLFSRNIASTTNGPTMRARLATRFQEGGWTVRAGRPDAEGELWTEPKLRCGQRAKEREALEEGAARIEFGRDRTRRAGVDERPRGRHGPTQEERSRRQQNRRDLARGEAARSFGPG